jgi:hypothetical protein
LSLRVLVVAVFPLAACGGPGESSDTPTLPCDVAAVLRDVCQHCHTDPPVNGAPFPLTTYADTQALLNYPPTYKNTPAWMVMRDAIQVGQMPPPYSGVTFSAAQKTTLLDWAAKQAPPAPPGTHCP